MTTTDETFEFGYRNGRQLSRFLVDVTAHGRENLARVLAVVLTDIVSGELRVGHYHIDPNRQLTLFGGPPRGDEFAGAVAFPKPATAEDAAAFVWDWLSKVEYARDEHDGHAVKGWRVFNERFGIVADCWQAFVAIRPMWIYIPK
jgi:hypothetical protein